MDRTKLIRNSVALIGLSVAMLLFFLPDKEKSASYYTNQGKIFGTFYTIQYEAITDLHDTIKATLQAFDNSLSMFNPSSTLSAINANRDTTTDLYFEQMWCEAQRVHALSNGAFDITIAPLVNFWGFGNKGRANTLKDTDHSYMVDSLRQLIGLEKVQLIDHHIVKSDPRIMLDGGAVAKGQACDLIAQLLTEKGCTNYLVEIGGEIVCHGTNSRGEPWRVGISRPDDDPSGQQEIQEIIATSDICMATSGNYRNFYYDGNEKRSHTIDPRTGYPVQHSLLSATVVSSSCMRADALATACMVLGAEKALEMIKVAEDASCYLLVAQADTIAVITSPNWGEIVIPSTRP